MRRTDGQSFRVLGLLAILAVVALFAVPVLVRILTPDRHVSQTDIGGAPAAPTGR